MSSPQPVHGLVLARTEDAVDRAGAGIDAGVRRWRSGRADPAFIATRIVAPTAILLLAAVVSTSLGVDGAIADRLYAAQGHAWGLRDSVLLSAVVHEGGRRLSALAWLGVVGAWAGTWWFARLRPWRAPLAWLALTVLAAVVLVAAIKSVTRMDCPWDLLRYGGDRPFIGLFSARPQGLADGACFPAGHASSGYAWLALAFFLGETRPRWRAAGALAAIVAGLVFGIAQQLRGAHFLSHDLVTAALCWAVAGASWALLWPRRRTVAA